MKETVSGIRWGILFKYVAVFVLGVIATSIFPPFLGKWYGFVAMIGFLSFLLCGTKSKKELFSFAYIFGFAFYAISFVWINNALLIDDDKFVAFVPIVFIATGLFFGLFWAIPALMIAFGKNVYSKALLLSVSFVFMEWVRSFIFTGFPWNLLGTALSFSPKLISGAAYVGTYGLSLILMLLLCGLAMLFRMIIERRFNYGAWLFILLPVLFLWGTSQGYVHCETSGGMKVRLVQPSIPQTLKWNQEQAYKNFRNYIDLSKEKSFDDVKIVVWGETATPYYLDYDNERLREITEAIPENGFLITGLIRLGYEGGVRIPYNSLFVIDKSGDIKDYYDKVHLVPFGEYLPLREYLPDFMRPIANVVGNLGRGEKYKNLQVKGLPLIGASICYEIIFPKEILNPKKKPQYLVVLANDGWYGISAGPYQHLAATQMRAVEEGITIIRSANSGISAVIASNGDILGHIGLNEIGILDVNLPIISEKETIYGMYGNVIVWGLLALLFVIAIMLNSINGCVKRD